MPVIDVEGRRSEELSLGRKELLALETNPALDCLLTNNDEGNVALLAGNDGRFELARCGEDATEDVGVCRPCELALASALVFDVTADPCLAGLICGLRCWTALASDRDVLFMSVRGEGEEFILGRMAGVDNECGSREFIIRRGERDGVGIGTRSVRRYSNNVQI
jgi:hypothetical protein